jgi:acyl-coenzyme A synthetase/AMP-(fatty) acid ligase
MRGYWGDAERTARTLRDLELGGRTRRAYRTGDLVRREDGQLLFQGRRDHQIKTRGYRVELGEIESALHGHAGVAEAVVVAIPDEEIGHRLRAFVVPRAPAPDAAALKDHCARTLPRYMVPEFIDFRDVLPRTASGKIDRTALAAEPPLARKDSA